MQRSFGLVLFRWLGLTGLRRMLQKELLWPVDTVACSHRMKLVSGFTDEGKQVMYKAEGWHWGSGFWKPLFLKINLHTFRKGSGRQRFVYFVYCNYLFSFFPPELKKKLKLSWSIIALHCCVSFCYSSPEILVTRVWDLLPCTLYLPCSVLYMLLSFLTLYFSLGTL